MRNQDTQIAQPNSFGRRKSKVLTRFVLSGFVIATVGSTGCKTASNMPGAGFLGLKKTPSAETLAGQGPSVTYPPTPGTNFNPTAIVSKSAGTGGASNVQNGSVPGNAALANGYAANANSAPTAGTAGPTTGPAGGAASATAPSYVTGGWGSGAPAKPATGVPSIGMPQSGMPASTPPSFANNTYSPPANTAMTMPGNSMPYTMPGNASIPNYGQNTYTPPPMTSSYANIDIPGYGPSTGANSAAGAGSAYQVANANGATGYGGTTSNPYVTPAGTSSGQSAPAMPTQMAGGFTIPSLGGSASTNGTSTGATGTGAGSNQGYRPGSTAGATSYPNTPYTAPNGSMYR